MAGPSRLQRTLANGGSANAGGLLLLTALSWIVYQTLGKGFLSSYNLFTLSQLAAETAIIGFSQLAVVVIGRLNLAVGAIAVCVVMATGWLVGPAGVPPVAALPMGLTLGTALGALLGVIEVATGLSSFIVTLAMSSILFGVVLIATGGAAISSIPPAVTDFSNASLLTDAVSLLVVPALALGASLWLLFNRSVWGWRMLAVGANQRAAELSGVRVSVTVVGSFALSGLLAAVAALMEMSRVASALPSLGVGWLLSSLVVPILGGTALVGGAVSVGGALVAALFIESINSGLVSLNVPAYWQQLAQSVILLVAVIVDQARRKRRRRPVATNPDAPHTTPTMSEGGASHAVP